MFKHLPRRKRGLAVVALTGSLFVIITATLFLVASRPDAPYRPGEDAEGITNELSREIPSDFQPVVFRDVADAAGISFQHFWGKRSSQLPEDMGSGAAWGDYDGDGWDDLFVANVAGPLTLSADSLSLSPATARLYRNNGNGTFTDVSVKAGVAYRGRANGVSWADYDGDGHLDVVMSTYGTPVLFHNQGDGTFVDRTTDAGFDQFTGFWTGVSWMDYDRDGRLDLYVCGYVRYERPEQDVMSRQYDIENPAAINPSTFPPERNLLFRNLGNGAFEEVGLRSGVSNPEGRSLSATWADLDEDGWMDLYVANDVSDNVLYRNLGDGTFEDISHPAWVADHRGAMGIAVGDWDGDTDYDIVVSHWLAQENALYNNQSAQDRRSGRSRALRFIDQADQFGLGHISLDYVGWATSFVDVDNDGRLDLFVVNGSTLQDARDESVLGRMNGQLFWNGGQEAGFFEVGSVSGEYFSTEGVGRGGAYSDYDRDGDLDLFIVHHGGRGVLLRNEGGNRSNWLEVRLRGSHDRDALGARLRLVAGGTTQVRQIGTQASYLSQNSRTEHFGLGTATRVDTLEVVWPDGERGVLTGIQPGRVLQLMQQR